MGTWAGCKLNFFKDLLLAFSMARNLIRKGVSLIAYDKDPARISGLTGAKLAGSPAEVGSAADVIFTMLPNSSHVQEVFQSVTGIFE